MCFFYFHLKPLFNCFNLEPFLSRKASAYIEQYLPDDFNSTLENLEKLIQVRKGLLDLMSGNYFNFEEKQSFGYSIEETIINCMFNGTICSELSQEFIWYYSYKYANCFTYNSGIVYSNETKQNAPLKRILRDGVEYGLSLEIYAGSREAQYSVEQYGAIVFIHNQSSLPESSSGILLKPGTQTHVVIEKSFNSYTPSPYSECQDFSTLKFDRTYYDTILQASLTYTQSLCLDLCLRKQIITKCNCSYLEFIQIHDSLPCSTDSELECAESLFYSFSYASANDSCSSKYHCPLECDSQEYSFTVSTSGYPTIAYAHMLKSSKTISTHFKSTPSIDEIREDVLKLNIYFDTDKYTSISQTRQYYEYDLFANTGGIVNLFHGLSILCLVQVFDFLFEIFMIFWSSRSKKPKYVPKRRGGMAEDTAIIEIVYFYSFFFLIIQNL